jgi:ribonuclease HI
MYSDGSNTLKEAEVRAHPLPPKGDIIKCAIQLKFSATNNIAEYEGLVAGLRLANALGIRWLLYQG